MLVYLYKDICPRLPGPNFGIIIIITLNINAITLKLNSNHGADVRGGTNVWSCPTLLLLILLLSVCVRKIWHANIIRSTGIPPTEYLLVMYGVSSSSSSSYRSCHTQLSLTYYYNYTLLWQHADISLTVTFTHTHTHTHTRLTALCPGLPGWAGTRKVQPIWILLKQETVSGSGTSWAVCKSAPRSRKITTPAPHCSVFYRPDALPAAQPTASKHWRQSHSLKIICLWII